MLRGGRGNAQYSLEAGLALQYIRPHFLDHLPIWRDEVETYLKQDILEEKGSNEVT